MLFSKYKPQLGNILHLTFDEMVGSIPVDNDPFLSWETPYQHAIGYILFFIICEQIRYFLNVLWKGPALHLFIWNVHGKEFIGNLYRRGLIRNMYHIDCFVCIYLVSF